MYKIGLFLFMLVLHACNYCEKYSTRLDHEIILNYQSAQPKGKYTKVHYVNLTRNEIIRSDYTGDTYLKLPFKQEPQTMILSGPNRADTITLSYTLELQYNSCDEYHLDIKTIQLDYSSNPGIFMPLNSSILHIGP